MAEITESKNFIHAFIDEDIAEGGRYAGKTVQLKGRVILDERSNGDFFVFGRQMMTCCVDDIQFAGVVCEYPDAFSLKNGQWATVTAEIRLGRHKAYDREGPILTVREVEPALPPEEEVASFY